MATKKTPLKLPPGRTAFEASLQANKNLFNLSEWERLIGAPSGTLRHISTGSRLTSLEQYKELQKIILPKMCEMVFTLQNYPDQFERRQETYW